MSFLDRMRFLSAIADWKRGSIEVGELAMFAARDAGIPDQGTESIRNRREAAARTAALARHSRKHNGKTEKQE